VAGVCFVGWRDDAGDYSSVFLVGEIIGLLILGIVTQREARAANTSCVTSRVQRR